MASYKVSDNCPDGCLVGNAATSKVGFYGATPVVQQTAPAALVPASDTTATISAAVNQLRTDLVNLGLIA